MQKVNTHPTLSVTDHNSGKFTTYSGLTIDLINPCEDDIAIVDIATSLSRICRFGGHTSVFYSVAQHSMVVASMLPKELLMHGLLHDAQEAYLGDVIKPLKVLLGASYASIETRFEDVIAQKFGLVWNKKIREEVKKADIAALHMEHDALKIGKRGALISLLNEQSWIINDTWAWPELRAKGLFSAYFMDIKDGLIGV